MTTHNFSQLILNWYHTCGRKNLPWQREKTLYKVWISEIMLQQTTVKTVIPYFEKFIKKFPNINSLNKSKPDDILYLWSGLGYYKRAENIYKTAKIIQKDYKGKFPKNFSNIIKFPGIGRSTAGAILSLTLNYSFPILEGNVKRILTRYYGIKGHVKETKVEKKLWHLIERLIPINNTGKFNQGIMDVGALICTTINPKCNDCPLKQNCIAYKNKEWEKYPTKKNKKIKLKKKYWFVIIKYKDKFWIKKNQQKTIWNNLFCFPYFESIKNLTQWFQKNEIDLNQKSKLASFNHTLSHVKLCINPILIELYSTKKFISLNNTGIWYNSKNPQKIGFPKPVKKILNILK
ncbi:A/G-specific adenine glycosylase [Buchnera aphidicola]|uniref:A/G-specific adenine glycosylase n=1 Tax=Buchnera aphidicola TaxID=9 RepID=UPI00164F3A38|nr:A/G-specific adenine glycosylase [Buchnera aphidicola]